jgi:hypothetical protein
MRCSLGRGWLIVRACIAFLSVVAGAPAQEHADDREAKSAYLYQFGAYVQWPDSAFARPDSPVVIAVAGADGLYEQLVQNVSGRTLGRRPVSARRLSRGEALAGTHILFIGNGAGAWATELLARSRKLPILVVTEAQGGLPPGSAVNFIVLDKRLRFDVHVGAAEANGLKLSALLLSAARQVVGKGT